MIPWEEVRKNSRLMEFLAYRAYALLQLWAQLNLMHIAGDRTLEGHRRELLESLIVWVRDSTEGMIRHTEVIP